MATDDQVCIQKLKSLRRVADKVDWKNVTNIKPCLKRRYIHRLCNLFKSWRGEYPVILDIFKREAIDHLLAHSVLYNTASDDQELRDIIIRFLIRSGYKDKGSLGEDGKPFVHRLTGIHLTARHMCPGWVAQIRDLFDVYTDFTANYRDELGFTHLHAASMAGCYYAVEKFMDHGHDINCRASRTGDTPLHLALTHERKHVAELLLTRGADPNIINAQGSTAFHLICKRCDDSAFVKLLIERYPSIAVDARDKHGNTPLHLSLQFGKFSWSLTKMMETLIRNGANPSLSNKKRSTALHMICERNQIYDLAKPLFDLCDELKQPMDINFQDNAGNAPLHIALRNGSDKLAEFLLRNNADPRLANKDGSTPLHVIRNSTVLEIFLKINEELDQQAQVDAQDKFHMTPLMWALKLGREDLVEILLKNGANPHLVNRRGQTPLHIICKRDKDDDEFLKRFLNINFQKPVRLNAKDKLGNTPLHVALISGNKKVAEQLLTMGVDCNSANKAGSTPLHIICSRRDCDSFVSKFFDICKMKNRTVNIDARDKKGRTPLQGAVANLSPKLIDLLIDNGASVADLAFPTANDFEAHFKPRNKVKTTFIAKLEILSNIMLVVEHLEGKGYEMGQDDAETIMSMFIKHKAFEQSHDFAESWFATWKFTEPAREIKIKMRDDDSSLSLQDLIELQHKETKKRFSFRDLRELMRSFKLRRLTQSYERACLVHLFEKMCRQFFRESAMDPFWKLIHFRVPLIPCEMIVEHLTNKELYNICLAAHLKK